MKPKCVHFTQMGKLCSKQNVQAMIIYLFSCPIPCWFGENGCLKL